MLSILLSGKRNCRQPIHGKLLAMSLAVVACGTEIGNPKKPKPEPQTPMPTSLVDDQNVASDLIASQADEVIGGVAEEATANDLNLNLQPPALTKTGVSAATPDKMPVSLQLLPASAPSLPQTTKVCAEQETGQATLVVKADGSFTKTVQRHGHPVTFAGTETKTTTSIWQHGAAAVKCKAANDGVDIDWAAADGLIADLSITGNSSVTASRDGGGDGHTRTNVGNLSGSRHYVWTRTLSADTSTTIALSKSVTGSLAKTFSSARKGGGTFSVATSIEINAAAPMQIVILRDKTTQAWQTKTIVSGAVVSQQGQDSRVEATYANLVFTPSSGCTPDSGTVTGKMFRGDATVAARTYKIDFSPGTATITYDDGTQAPYLPSYCVLDGSQ